MIVLLMHDVLRLQQLLLLLMLDCRRRISATAVHKVPPFLSLQGWWLGGQRRILYVEFGATRAELDGVALFLVDEDGKVIVLHKGENSIGQLALRYLTKLLKLLLCHRRYSG